MRGEGGGDIRRKRERERERGKERDEIISLFTIYLLELG